MKLFRKLCFILLSLTLTAVVFSACSKKNSCNGAKVYTPKMTSAQKKIARKQEKDAKRQAKVDKALGKYQLEIQDKATRKRMKKNRKAADKAMRNRNR